MFDQSREQRLKAFQERLKALQAAAGQGRDGLSLLCKGLEDNHLKVRSLAYEKLKLLGETSVELERGIPLKRGDEIYAVYQAGITSDGDWQHSISYSGYPMSIESNLHTKEDSEGNSFQCLSDAPEDKPSRFYSGLTQRNSHAYLYAYCVDQTTAHAKKEKAYRQAFAHLPCPISCIRSERTQWEYNELRGYNVMTSTNFDSGDFDLRTWVEANEVILEEKDLSGWNYYNQMDYGYTLAVIESLHKQERFDLLRGIWPLIGHRPMACVQVSRVDRPCYLQPHNP